MSRRALTAAAAACTAAVIAVAATAPVAPANPLGGDNQWLAATDDGFTHIAHRGGGAELPEHTLFAYSETLSAGTEVLEADIYMTLDEQLIVLHDATVDRTTDGSGPVSAFTLSDLKQLDNAYRFCPPGADCEADGYPYRGIATGDVAPPAGYTANDFRIMTLREALTANPDIPFVIELKPDQEQSGIYEKALADLLHELGRTDVIVASFIDTHLELFKAFAPDIDTSFATGQAAVFSATQKGPGPGHPARHKALQVPINFGGVPVVDQDYVDDAHANGLAVHVWTVNDCDEMAWLLDLGVDGIMTDYPTRLQAVLTAWQADGAVDCSTIA